VSIASSGSPDRIALITEFLVPGAEARWAADAVADADLVILAIPLHRFAELDPALVAGKVVVDVMNYWPPVNGVVPMFEHNPLTSSEIVQRHLPTSTVVKSLNQIGYHDLDELRRPAGSPERLAIGVAGDDPAAVETVAQLIERIGYDAVPLNGLSFGRLLEPGGPVFGALMRKGEFEMVLGARAA
jgi:predicted dinucleotide-binding enzyme